MFLLQLYVYLWASIQCYTLHIMPFTLLLGLVCLNAWIRCWRPCRKHLYCRSQLAADCKKKKSDMITEQSSEQEAASCEKH